MKKLIVLGVAAACVAGAVSLWAQTGGTVTEPETGKTFPMAQAFGGADHTLVGVGAFEAFGAVNVYGGAFFIDATAGQRAWQRFLANQAASFVRDGVVDWAALKNSTTLYQWIYSGSFGKAIWFKFVLSVTRQEIIDINEDIMRSLVPDFDNVSKQPPLKTFIDATCQDVTEGQEMTIWSRGSTVWVKLADKPLVTVEDAASIIRAVWQLWFGANPVSVPLRRALVDKIENLGGPAPAAP
jgi:hypothetical protein